MDLNAFISHRASPTRGCQSERGMTVLEVLIAVMLFAVFSAVFLAVTEMTSALLLGEAPSQAGSQCSGKAEDRACVELYFDELVKVLERSTYPAESGSEFADAAFGATSHCKSNPEILFSDMNASEAPDSPWPSDYDVCIYAYEELSEDLTASTPKPGLYLLQAQPAEGLDASAARQAVQRLFCRPRYLCS